MEVKIVFYACEEVSLETSVQERHKGTWKHQHQREKCFPQFHGVVVSFFTLAYMYARLSDS